MIQKTTLTLLISLTENVGAWADFQLGVTKILVSRLPTLSDEERQLLQRVVAHGETQREHTSAYLKTAQDLLKRI